MQTLDPPNRIEHLDGLRGIAALVVVLGHYSGAFLPLLSPTASLSKTVSVLFDGGFSVFVFFVLSGFVLAQSSTKSKSGLIATVVARYFRLTVPMLISLILAWFLVHQFRETRIEFQRVAQNKWLTNAFYTDQNPNIWKAIKDGVYGVYMGGFSYFDGPVWTMRKELLGSIAVYVIYLLWPARYRWLALTAFGLVTLFGARFYLGFPLGLSLREMWVRGLIHSSRLSWIVLSVSLLCAWGLRAIDYNNTNLLALAAAGVVFSVMTLPKLQTFLDSAIPQFLGRISFALYLVHLPLILSVVAWSYLHFNCPTGLKFGLCLIIFLIIAFALAWLITISVDEPLVRILHRLKKALSFEPHRQRQGLALAEESHR